MLPRTLAVAVLALIAPLIAPRIAPIASPTVFALAASLPALPALASPEGWHRTLDDGLKAAKKSGKPVLMVTAWSNEQ